MVDRVLRCGCYGSLNNREGVAMFLFMVFWDIVFWALLESFRCLLGFSGWLPGCFLSLSGE